MALRGKEVLERCGRYELDIGSTFGARITRDPDHDIRKNDCCLLEAIWSRRTPNYFGALNTPFFLGKESTV